VEQLRLFPEHMTPAEYLAHMRKKLRDIRNMQEIPTHQEKKQ
jgi:hypothetical protein